MQKSVSHDRQEESIESKTLWFQSLSLEARMEMLCAYTDLILEVIPTIVEKKDAEPIEGRILVLSKT